MTKRYFILVLALIVSLSTISAYADSPIKKLGRGLCNIVSSPLELLQGIQDANNEGGFLAAFTWGVLKGLFQTGVRAGVGVYEVVTFPIPFPKDFEPILENPEFFGEEKDR
ncbi:MAG: exosortase system-associated protein, TIGR04073 family [Candidatus Omnitrophica bacterium]|nr:exosortase system-associated protein, TIGR04073 family [Candidatus Omnitrophota bacterium]